MKIMKMAAGCAGVAVLLALAGGCASTGYEKAERSAVSMDKTEAEVQEAYRQVTTSFTALDAVMTAKVGDLRPLFEAYVSEVKSLQYAADAARSRALKMQAQNQSYFTSWAQDIESIQDPATKGQSLKRYNDTLTSYKAVEKLLVQTGDAYVPLMATLNDIQTALSQDLTPAGVVALRPAHQKVRQQAIELQGVMKNAMAAIKDASAKLTPRASGASM